MDLTKDFKKSVEELHNKIDLHYSLMAAMLEYKIVNEKTGDWFLQHNFSDENVLKQAIKETIEVLEESRRAFKSKKLEVLRKKLTKILMQT